jgi:hypothetical protein
VFKAIFASRVTRRRLGTITAPQSQAYELPVSVLMALLVCACQAWRS